MNATGRKMTTSESDVAATARSTSLVPSMAARTGGRPSSSIFLKMFSSTTIASSMTMPTASVRPRSVIVFSVKPSTRIRVKLAMSEAGIDRALMIIAGMLRMKSSTTRLARRLPRMRCSWSAAIEALMKRDSSCICTSVRPAGSCGWSVLSAALRPAMTAIVFCPDWRRMSMRTARWPWTKTADRASSWLSSTCATSATRIGAPPWVATTIWPN